MAYDEELAHRLRELLADEGGVTEMKMFGGLAFLIDGNMAVAASGGGGLLLRVEPDQTDQLCQDEHAAPFEMRGKPMQGWLRVDAEGVGDEPGLRRWVQRGVSYARSLPPKR